MKPDTPIILEFLDKHISTKLSNIPKLKFSAKSSGLLDGIFNNFQKAEQEYIRIEKHMTIQTIDIKHGLLKGNDYHFCCPEIRKHIEKTSHYQRQYSFEIKNRSIVVAMVYPNTKTNNQVNSFFEKSIKRIYMWLYTAVAYAPEKCSNKLNIYLYFTDLIKLLPDKGSPIDKIHANTAATRSCNKTNEIHLYREEEWFKVLIHESFHCFGLDFSEFDCTKTTNYILKLFPVNSQVLLYETYCEMWAEILNVMFVSYFSTRPIENLNDNNKPIGKMIKKMENMLEKEQEFSLFQCIKVLHFYGLNYNDLHEQSAIAHNKRTRQYKENTNILSYYILKSIYMFFVNDFVEWCVENNDNSINFNKDTDVLNETQTKYCEFIGEHYKEQSYVDTVDALKKWFDKMENKKINEKIELRTLRMSVYEM
jgi:hypothetical protein